ncbi:ComEC/Rec2 family competence protein [Desulforamulus ferrireducens]|uniref:MBL fold metallo-hydrolase n=1 Tax=Desulforamulus ferrireducens TaxID=1833852 RepID=A0A1S6IYZ3_9FIRM|nr:MBL fold metallo-hydrolase [Desulforamulus ferrireducens]AQS59990.1 MBL fold metallo-hydrolase [Desulforamulus ferrireducens]
MKRIVILVLIMLLLLTGCTGQKEQATPVEPGDNLRVHFIDVGQADAILVQSQQASLLIDAGNNEDGQLVTKYLRQQGIERLDVVMGTHPHEDHIGGLDTVIKQFDVAKVYLPKVNHNTKSYQDVLLAIKDKNLKVTAAAGGQEFNLGAARVEILAPNSNKYQVLNDYSIVCKITYGQNSFLLTGDAEELSEQEMLKKGYNLKADVLKVGHHGSYSSTSEDFLKAVAPEMAVISVAKENDYGHPHKEIMQRLADHRVKVYLTSQVGTIVMTSDGREIVVQTEKQAPAEVPLVPTESQTYVDANGQGLIKGNINKNGEKIYHLPGMQNYERTKPEVWFKTEDEARAAGFRRASK